MISTCIGKSRSLFYKLKQRALLKVPESLLQTLKDSLKNDNKQCLFVSVLFFRAIGFYFSGGKNNYLKVRAKKNPTIPGKNVSLKIENSVQGRSPIS